MLFCKVGVYKYGFTLYYLFTFGEGMLNIECFRQNKSVITCRYVLSFVPLQYLLILIG